MKKTSYMISAILGMLLPVISTAAVNTTQPLDDIREAAVNFVREQYSQPDEDVRIRARKLDPRLKLARCEKPLVASMPYSYQGTNQSLVQVSCEGEIPWSLHVPVKVVIYREIAVATRALAQGTLLSDSDMALRRVDTGPLAGGYLDTLEDAEGQVLTRPVQAGQALYANYLKPPTVVRRGQTITLLARQAGFEVRSSGESLMDGAIGDRIRVKNSRSRRVVEGVVSGNGIVFVK